MSYRWYPRSETMKEARIVKGLYRCNACKGSFRRDEIQLDHVEPIVDPLVGFTTWDSYVLKLLPGKSGHQVLCKPCHKTKTGAENSIRRATKGAAKTRRGDK